MYLLKIVYRPRKKIGKADTLSRVEKTEKTEVKDFDKETI